MTRIEPRGLASGQAIVTPEIGGPEVVKSMLRKSPVWVKSGHRIRSAPYPLYPQKRTSFTAAGMSALCQKRTHALQQSTPRLRQVLPDFRQWLSWAQPALRALFGRTKPRRNWSRRGLIKPPEKSPRGFYFQYRCEVTYSNRPVEFSAFVQGSLVAASTAGSCSNRPVEFSALVQGPLVATSTVGTCSSRPVGGFEPAPVPRTLVQGSTRAPISW